jgi:hypothetical protein
MDKRAVHLATLGLAPDASWEEVTQAYKDLMRVWHPDRFQGDERLRKKAEAQAQRINAAMSELRTLGKEHQKATRQHTNQHTNQRSASTTQTDKTTQASQHGRTHRSANSTSRSSSAERQSSHSSFLIAPLYIRQRFTTSLVRILASSAIFYICYTALNTTSASPRQHAACLALAFLALDFGVRNLTVMVLPKPVISIERNGLFFLKTGRLGWSDIEGAWPVLSPRYQQLSLMLSQHYLSKRNVFIRMLLHFRRWAKTPHVIIPFNGLTADPVAVINAMRLRQLHQDVTIEEPAHQPRGLLMATMVVSALCVAVAVTRCAMGLSASPIEYLPYFILVGLARATGVVLRVLRS